MCWNSFEKLKMQELAIKHTLIDVHDVGRHRHNVLWADVIRVKLFHICKGCAHFVVRVPHVSCNIESCTRNIRENQEMDRIGVNYNLDRKIFSLTHHVVFRHWGHRRIQIHRLHIWSDRTEVVWHISTLRGSNLFAIDSVSSSVSRWKIVVSDSVRRFWKMNVVHGVIVLEHRYVHSRQITFFWLTCVLTFHS